MIFYVHRCVIQFSAVRGVNQWDLQLREANQWSWGWQQKVFKMECCSQLVECLYRLMRDSWTSYIKSWTWSKGYTYYRPYGCSCQSTSVDWVSITPGWAVLWGQNPTCTHWLVLKLFPRLTIYIQSVVIIITILSFNTIKSY